MSPRQAHALSYLPRTQGARPGHSVKKQTREPTRSAGHSWGTQARRAGTFCFLFSTQHRQTEHRQREAVTCLTWAAAGWCEGQANANGMRPGVEYVQPGQPGAQPHACLPGGPLHTLPSRARGWATTALCQPGGGQPQSLCFSQTGQGRLCSAHHRGHCHYSLPHTSARFLKPGVNKPRGPGKLAPADGRPRSQREHGFSELSCLLQQVYAEIIPRRGRGHSGPPGGTASR